MTVVMMDVTIKAIQKIGEHHWIFEQKTAIAMETKDKVAYYILNQEKQ